MPFRYLHSFPTRRSSDLDRAGTETFRRCARTRFRCPVLRALRYGTCSAVGREPHMMSLVRLLGFTTLGCGRSEEHTSELQSRLQHVCRLLLDDKKHNHTD